VVRWVFDGEYCRSISTDNTNLDGVYGSIFLMVGSNIEALPCACRDIWVPLLLDTDSSMTDLLSPNVSLSSDTLGVVEFPVVNPGIYYIECR
jgi:hypothetical protein